MQDINYWLDAQISEAKRMERELDEMDKHEEALFWYGRWQALWEVKKMIKNG